MTFKLPTGLFLGLSIRTRMLLLVLAAALPAVAGMAWLIATDNQRERDNAYASVRAVGETLAGAMERELDDYEVRLARLAQRPNIRALDPKTCDPILADFAYLRPEMNLIALRDVRGNAICSLTPHPPSQSDTLSTAWFQEGIRSGKFFASDVFTGPASKRQAVALTYPIRDGAGQVSGLLILSLDLLKLQQRVFHGLPKGAFLTVFDRQYRFLLRSIEPEKFIGMPLPDAQLHAIRDRQGDLFRAPSIKGVMHLWAYVPVPKTGWHVAVGMPEDEVLANQRSVMAQSIALVLGALLLVGMLAGWVVQPLFALARTVARIAGGDTTTVIDVAGPSEVASIATELKRLLAEREASLASLEASRTLLNSLVSNIPAMVFVKRASDLRFERLNRAGEQLLGYSEEELVGKNDYDFFPPEQADFFTASDREVLAGGQLKDIPQEPVVARNGETKLLHTRKVGIYNAAGEPTHLLGVSIDITEQVRAEASLREAQRIAQVGSWELDMVTGSLLWSDEIFHLFEIDQSRFGATYQAFLDAIHPDDREAVNHAYTRSLETRSPYLITHRLRMADGRIKWVQERCESQFDADGKPLRSQGTVQDVTRQTEAEEALRNSNAELEQRVVARTALLRAAKEQAEQANEAKTRFLSSMSHELRTPLNAILGYAQIMEMGSALTATERGNVGEIRRAGDHLLSLVNDILDLARIESGKLDFQIETVDLATVLAECRAQNIQEAHSRNIAFVQGCDCERYQVLVDHRRLLQALNNLVSNAIKYNRENGSVTVSCGAPAGGRVRITVSDTGPGISPEKLAQMYQPFNRLGAEMGSIEGTGIGLLISRELLEGMDGRMGFDSTPGVGSSFWLEMPGQEGAEAAEPTLSAQFPPSADATPGAANRRPPTPADAGSGQAQPGQLPRVLVAEDFEPNRAVLISQLTTLGWAVDMVPNGAEALEKWRSRQYELILTDINMPVMDGLELVRALRDEEQATGRHTHVVAITAAVVPSELQRCRDAGIDEVLSKPISLEDLQRVLARWTGVPARAEEPSRHAESSATSEDAVLDLNQLYRILGQVSLEHARELAATFIRSATEGLEYLASRAADAAAVAREMHKQKSSARTLGALRYAKLAEALEQQAKAGGTISLEALRAELAGFEAAAARLAANHQAAGIGPDRSGLGLSLSCKSVLVIDDDPVVLQQMTLMLSALGVPEVLTADNGLAALRIMQQRGGALEALVCDLNMPEMDGVQLIRQFRQTDFKGGLILMSGADEKVLSTVSELAGRQGLRVLGHAQKPLVPAQIAALLGRLTDSISGKRQHGATAEVSAEAIQEGIYNDEFSVWFQPKVDALSLRPVGVEALARWRRPDGSFVPPDTFIVAAERQGLIGELSQILVSKSLLEGARLHDLGFPLKIAVNLSGRWLDDLNLPDFVLATVHMAGLKAPDVLFEVTETGVMEDLTTALDVLSRLRLKGFGLSIDDFGIGYSSFEQLGRIPFTEMKLDRSFVIKGNQDVAARAILESSMDMAHKLGLATVAEGVETDADLDLVRTLGCDSVQGFLLARPMPLTELLPWLKSSRETAS